MPEDILNSGILNEIYQIRALRQRDPLRRQP